MSWWVWLLVWIVLVLGALAVLFVLGRSLFRKAVALAHELGEAADRLSAVSEELQALGEGAPAPVEAAVFADPAELRRERVLSRRAAGRKRPGRRATG